MIHSMVYGYVTGDPDFQSGEQGEIGIVRLACEGASFGPLGVRLVASSELCIAQLRSVKIGHLLGAVGELRIGIWAPPGGPACAYCTLFVDSLYTFVAPPLLDRDRRELDFLDDLPH